ncbi:hypothetical protein EDB92DRAFT_1822001 [Lactarius akahatsu]|uniref:Uncharacterized protein n=1 Tax=Lactarius akahatsu TaxID=416441 RepID=A0AAD4Q7A7_9AGAM|nr:hypothetical protein EDB92DRAFT_1822001 [Lactarius akahatsu]
MTRYKHDLEDTYRSLLYGENGARDGNNGSSDEDDADHRSDDSEWDDEATLVETLARQNTTKKRSFTRSNRRLRVASHDLDEDIILALLPVLNQGRNARPAPGREFITGLLGFDDVCKRFEKGSYRSAGFDAAYAKIEVHPIAIAPILRASF